MNRNDSNSMKPENGRNNDHSNPIKRILDETNDVDKDLINVYKNPKSIGYASTKNEERNTTKAYQNASNTQISCFETRSLINPANNRSKDSTTSDGTVKRIQEKVYNEEYDEDDDGMVKTNEEDSSDDNIKDRDGQIDLSRDNIQKKNMANLIFDKAKMMKFQKGTNSITNQSAEKTKKNGQFGESGTSVPFLKLFKHKDKTSLKEIKSKSTNINESTSLIDETYDEDRDKSENERARTLGTRDERKQLKINERAQHETSKTSFDKEYDEDDGQDPALNNDEIPHSQVIQNCGYTDKNSLLKPQRLFKQKLKHQNRKPETLKTIFYDAYEEDQDPGTSEGNTKGSKEHIVVQNNTDSNTIYSLKALKFFNKKSKDHNVRDKVSKGVSNEEYDEDDDLGLPEANVKMSKTQIHQDTDSVLNTEDTSKVSLFKSSKFLIKGSKKDDTNLKWNLKALKSRIVKAKEDGEMYDEYLFDPEEEKDSTDDLQKDQGILNRSDDIYDGGGDGIVKSNGEDPGDENIYDEDDQTGLSGDNIQKKNMTNLIFHKAKMMTFQKGTTSKINQTAEKTKKNGPFRESGKSTPLLKLFKYKDKHPLNVKCIPEENKSRSTNIDGSNSLIDETYDEDADQDEKERSSTSSKRDEIGHPNFPRATQLGASKNTFEEEYDEDQDPGTLNGNMKISKEPKVVQNNTDSNTIYHVKALKFFNKKSNIHDMKDKTSKSVSNEEYDEDNYLGLPEANVKISNNQFPKDTDLVLNTEDTSNVSLFKSSKFLFQRSKKNNTNLKWNLKTIKSKIVKAKEDGELYDEELFDSEEEKGSTGMMGSIEVLQTDQIPNDCDDIYDEDEDFQVANKERHVKSGRSLDRIENIFKKSSKLELPKKYIKHQIKNLKIKEKDFSEYLKRKIENAKLFSKSLKMDRDEKMCKDDWNEIGDNESEDIYDYDVDFENSRSTSNDVCELENTTYGSKCTHEISPELIDKKLDNCKNLETKDKMKNLVRRATDNECDGTPSQKRNTNESIKRNYEKNRIKFDNHFDTHSIETENVTDRSPKFKHVVKYLNEKVTDLKKSKKFIFKGLNLNVSTMKDILTNHKASNKSENDEEYASDSNLTLNEEDKDLKSSSHSGSNDNCTTHSQNERLRNITNDNSVDDTNSLGVPTCSPERSAKRLKADTVTPLKQAPSRSFINKWHTFDTKRKKFSKDVQLKIKKMNSKLQKKNNIDVDMYDEDNIGIDETNNDAEEYYDETEDEEEIERSKYRNDSQAAKSFRSYEILIHGNQVNKEDSDNGKELKDACENEILIKENKRIRKGKTEGKSTCNDSNKSFKREIKAFRETKRINISTFVDHSRATEFQKPEDMHVDVNAQQCIEKYCLHQSNSQNSSHMEITTPFKDNLEEFLDKRIQSFIEKWYETAGLPCHPISTLQEHDSGHVISQGSKGTKKDMKIEVFNKESKDQEGSIVGLTRCESFPLIKKRYNIQMLLEYFDRSREIVDIKTEVLDIGQQVVHITLGEAGRNQMYESDMEKYFRNNIKVKKSSGNDSRFNQNTYTEMKDTDKEIHKLFNGEINENRVINSRGIFPGCKDKTKAETSDSDKDKLKTTKGLSTKHYQKGATSPLNSPVRIPNRAKHSVGDMNSKHARIVKRDPEFQKDQNT